MKRYTVIFLVSGDDEDREILFLRRADTRRFAPGFYTGVGGKVESGESAMEGAIRELAEETGISNGDLKEFANLIVNDTVVVYYFTARQRSGPVPHCPEGILQWLPVAEIADKRIITSTYFILEEWQRRFFSWNAPFTITVVREDIDDPESSYASRKTGEGLKGYLR